MAPTQLYALNFFNETLNAQPSTLNLPIRILSTLNYLSLRSLARSCDVGGSLTKVGRELLTLTSTRTYPGGAVVSFTLFR
jgi:hypothetical protein